MRHTPYEAALEHLAAAAEAAELELDWAEPRSDTSLVVGEDDSLPQEIRLVSRHRSGRWIFRWTRTRDHGVVYLRKDSAEGISGVRWHCFDPAKADILREHLDHLPRLESAIRLRPGTRETSGYLQPLA